MTDDRETSLHADEADIVRWLDGALTGDEQKALEAHIAGCAECSERRATIVRRLERFSRLLRKVDVLPSATALHVPGGLPRHAPAPLRWRIAAVIALSLTGAAAVQPVRAWVASMARSAWTFATGPGRSAAPPSQGEIPGAVTFTPAGKTLTIRAPTGANATLTVEVVEGERVSAVGSEGQPLPGLLVLPEELRIEENNGGVTNYLVRVPLGLRTVRIIIGERREQTIRPAAIGERVTVSLAP